MNAYQVVTTLNCLSLVYWLFTVNISLFVSMLLSIPLARMFQDRIDLHYQKPYLYTFGVVTLLKLWSTRGIGQFGYIMTETLLHLHLSKHTYLNNIINGLL
jgi:hypothetical protein